MGKKSSKPAPKKSSKKKKKGEGGVSAPERNIAEEINQAVTGLEGATPRLLNLSQQYDAKFAETEAATAEARAKAEAGAVERAAPAMRQALFDGSPELKLASEKLLAGLNDTGPSAIEQQLQQQAQDELSLGGNLSGDELRQISQGERAAWSDRGLGLSPAASASEILARVGASNQRKAERRAFAGAVDAQSNQRQESDRNFTLAATNQAAATFDPYQRILGQGSQLTGASQTNAQFGNFLNEAASVGEGNQSASIQAAIANQQAKLQRDAMAQERYAFDMNRKDSLANSKANNSAAASAGRAQRNAGYATAGATALIALAAFL